MIAPLLVPAAVLAQKPPPTAAGAPGQTSPGSGVASATGAGRIGIGTIGPSTLAADLRIRIEDAAAAALTAAGADVVPAAEVARARTNAGLGGCADSVCEQRLAQITVTQYWLRGVCQMDTSSYRLHLELVDARSGAVMAARDDTCDICTEADVAETTRVAAQALRVALVQSQAAPATSVVATSSPEAASPDRGRAGKPTWRKVLPWVAFAGAAGAVAGGIYLISIDGGYGRCMPGNSDQCDKYHDTLAGGVALVGLGVALAATGIVLLALPSESTDADARRASASVLPRPQQTGVVVSLGQVAIAGRF